MKQIIYLIIFILTITSVSALEMSGDIGTTSTHHVNLTLLENQTAYINLVQKDDRISHQYTSERNFTNSVIEINTTIEGIFAENENISSLFEISNNINTEFMNYTLPLEILVNSSLTNTTTYNLSIVNGDFLINTTSDKLPIDEDLNYRLQGEPNTNLNVTCDGEWLSCNTQHPFNSDGIVDFTIHILIPEDTSLGTYTLPIFFETHNQTLSKNIKVYIDRAEITYEEYNFTDDCTRDINGTTYYFSDCVLEMQEYYLKIATELTFRLNEEQNKNCTGEIEYIVAGNVSQIIMDELDSCKSDRQINQDKYVTSSENLKTCNKDLDTWKAKFVNNETECWQNIVVYQDEADSDAQKFIDNEMEVVTSYKNRWLFILWTPYFIVLIFFVYKYYKKKNEDIF